MRTFFLLAFTLCLTGLDAQNDLINVRFADDAATDLQQRLTPLLTASGIQPDELAGVHLDIRFQPVRENRIDGMQTRVRVAYELSVNLRIGGSGEIISSQVVAVQGIGTDADAARGAALRALRPGIPQVDQLIQGLRADYERTFGADCERLLAGAEQRAQNEDLLTALTIANAVPPSSLCYAQARAARERYYLAYQTANCATHLQWARAHLVMEVPQAAVEELAKIDPASTCADEVRQMLEEAAALMKDQQTKKALFLRQVYQNQVKIEEARNTIISDLTKG